MKQLKHCPHPSIFGPTVSVIQGGSRGIGAAFVQGLLRCSPKNHVIATSRNPYSADSRLPKLRLEFPDRLTILPCNIWCEDEIQATAEAVKSKFKKVDFLLNCSGILNLEQKGETNLKQVNEESLLAAYRTNAMGPLLMVKHFKDMLSKQASEHQDATFNSVVVNISARVGSISDNRSGGWYAYRSSKAAQNMMTKTMAIELYTKKVLCVGLHPGTVNTDFSKRYHKNLKHTIFDPEQVVDYFNNVLHGLNMEDTGKFLDFNGKEIPW
eukprot:CFRG5833T1